MPTTTGVYPCYENQFKVNTSSSSTATWSAIADCETFGVSFDNGVEEWTPYDSNGWARRLMTAKKVTISVTAKRNIGDTGNNFIAGKTYQNGREAEADVQWTFPDSTVVTFTGAVINVKSNGGGKSTDVAPLEFDIMSNGAPTVTLPSGGNG